MAVSQAYRKWYDKNKETHNAKRRIRYQSDPVHRSNIQKRTRAHREALLAQQPAKTEFTIGEAATKIGRDIQSIRNWEVRGYIPRDIDARGYRIYNQHQIGLLKEFSDFMREKANMSPCTTTEVPLSFLMPVRTLSSSLMTAWPVPHQPSFHPSWYRQSFFRTDKWYQCLHTHKEC